MKKKLLLSLGITLLLIAMVGFWGYNKYFKFDPEVQKQLNQELGEDFFNISVDEIVVSNLEIVENTELEKNMSETDTSEKERQTEQVNNVVEKEKPTQKVTPEPPISSTTEIKTVTQDEITQKYMPKIDSLQSIALNRLDTLFATAIKEYEQAKKDGTLNSAQLAQKYLQAGNLLEDNVDGQFYDILDKMQDELVANNFPTDIISAIKNKYEKAKSEKRAQLLSKYLR